MNAYAIYLVLTICAAAHLRRRHITDNGPLPALTDSRRTPCLTIPRSAQSSQSG